MMDVAVLILFFNRADSLQQVFEAVRKAQPRQLFLYQDGPRGERDMAGIEACRKVVADVDWPCEVHRNYSAVNRGCDPSEYLSQKWAFSHVERCIVLEDDDVPTQSFFTFCQEMLERYAYDETVGMIQGFNPEEHTPDVPGGGDYFFTRHFSIWGWASWRRVIDRWDGDYAWLDDPQAVADLEGTIRREGLRSDFLPMCRAHKAQGKEFYETIFCAEMWRRGLLAVCPAHNLISNLGVSDDSTHFAGSVEQLPRAYRRIFTMGRHDLPSPLRHPAGSDPGEPHTEHRPYRDRVYRIMAWDHPWIKVARSLEELLINARHGQWAHIGRAIRARWSKLTRGHDYR